MTYDRKVLVDVLVYHYRDDIKGCGCGWAELGRSWPEHVATVYEESVAAHGEHEHRYPFPNGEKWLPCDCGDTFEAALARANESLPAVGNVVERNKP